MWHPGAIPTLSIVDAIVLAAGVLAVTSANSVFTTLGVLFIIVGLMGLMPIVRLGLSGGLVRS